MKFSLFDWSDMDRLTRETAAQVRASGQTFDRIIAVANGGLTMARHFGDQIGLRKISLLQTAFYAGVGQTHDEPTILQPLAVDVTGERLLIFEDIVDTGATLEFIQPLLTEQYLAKSVTVAALAYKSWASVKPDFSAQQLDTWIIYPYETQETIQTLQKKWHGEGVSDSEIFARLVEIGFTWDDLSAFLLPLQKLSHRVPGSHVGH